MKWCVEMICGEGEFPEEKGNSQMYSKCASVSVGKILSKAAQLKIEMTVAGYNILGNEKEDTNLVEIKAQSKSTVTLDNESTTIFSALSSPTNCRQTCSFACYGFLDGEAGPDIILFDENTFCKQLYLQSNNVVGRHKEVFEIASFEETIFRPALYEGGDRLKNAISYFDEDYCTYCQEYGFARDKVYMRRQVQERIKRLNYPNSVSSNPIDAGDIILFTSMCCLPPQKSKVADAFISLIISIFPGALPLSQSLAQAVSNLRPLPPPKPTSERRNVLITSALPYVNNVPHLGNIIGCVLSADVYSRYCRARGDNVLYVCGTDEYGTATETKAFEMGVSAREICDHYHEVHRAVYEWFEIEFDHFGRTSTTTQTEIAQNIFKQLNSKKMLIEETQEQLYSDKLGKFLADRYVVGVCPKCGYEDARGDQCDNCGSLLNPTELKNARCKFTGSVPRTVDSQHMFIDLPSLTGKLTEYVSAGGERWSTNCNMITAAWLRDGLKPRCITRDLSWGTPVPVAGYEKKVFYVWFDAPIGYISITACLVDDWESWWKNPEQVELVQFMGKDNVPFHTVIFPSTLLGTGENWTMMHRISVTEYLNYESGKFSKSRGVGVFGNNVQETGINVDVYRYYLLSMRPEQADTMFAWSDLASKNNSELLANLGNFCNRALKFTSAQFNGMVPPYTDEMIEKADELGSALVPALKKYVSSMDKMKMREALYDAMAVSRLGNGFMQETAPWVLIKSNPDAAATVVASALGVVRLVAIIIRPFMPGLSRKLMRQAGLMEEEVTLLPDSLIDAAAKPYSLIPANRKIGVPEPLFSKITDEQVEDLRERFSGQQVDVSTSSNSSETKTSKKVKEPDGQGKSKQTTDNNKKQKKQSK